MIKDTLIILKFWFQKWVLTTLSWSFYINSLRHVFPKEYFLFKLASRRCKMKIWRDANPLSLKSLLLRVILINIKRFFIFCLMYEIVNFCTCFAWLVWRYYWLQILRITQFTQLIAVLSFHYAVYDALIVFIMF